jgi:hypothetical protein
MMSIVILCQQILNVGPGRIFANVIGHREETGTAMIEKTTQIKFRLIFNTLSRLLPPNQHKKYRAAIEKKSFSFLCFSFPVHNLFQSKSMSFSFHRQMSLLCGFLGCDIFALERFHNVFIAINESELPASDVPGLDDMQFRTRRLSSSFFYWTCTKSFRLRLTS